jgi:NitT/TauT family transport system substrate-binding protein
MSRRNTLIAAVIAVAAGLVAAGQALAADKITIMVGGIEKQIYLPAALTESLGYFKDE